MKKLIVFLPAVLLIFTSSCKYCKIKGSGNMVTDTRAVSGYSKVELRGGMDVNIATGNQQEVIVEADDNLIGYVQTTLDGNKLVIDMNGNGNYCSDQITVTVITPYASLDEIILSGSGRLTNQASTDTNQVKFILSGSGYISSFISTYLVETTLSGSGTINFEGTATWSKFDVDGSGKIEAFELQSYKTEAEIAGSGDIETLTTDSLFAHIAGSGTIYYKGNPAVDQHITGSGNVIHVQ